MAERGMTQLGPAGVGTADPAFSTALPQPLSCLGDRARGRAVENAASPNTTNRQHTSKPFVGGRRPRDDLLSKSANGIIAHHLKQFPARRQARNIALRSGSFRYWN